MYISSAHPIECTAHTMMFDRKYKRRVHVPLVRKLASVSLRFGVIELLENNANIVRVSWDRYYSFRNLTIVIVKR